MLMGPCCCWYAASRTAPRTTRGTRGGQRSPSGPSAAHCDSQGRDVERPSCVADLRARSLACVVHGTAKNLACLLARLLARLQFINRYGGPLSSNQQGRFSRPYDIAIDKDGFIYVRISGRDACACLRSAPCAPLPDSRVHSAGDLVRRSSCQQPPMPDGSAQHSTVRVVAGAAQCP